MRVAVTGGSGFLGKHVCRELRSKRHTVFAPDRRRTNLMTSAGRLSLLAYPKPDAVVHLAAAVGGIGANAAQPGRFYYENLSMGMELMELARKRGVRKFVTVGTTCEYPEDAPQPLAESSIWDGRPTGPTSAYGLAKRALLEMGLAYREQYGFNAVHLLPTNLYGPEDHFDLESGHVIPSLIKRYVEASDGDTITLWGTGHATRDFLYVEDAARAIRLAVERYDSPEPLNLGSGEEHFIEAVARLIASITGFMGWTEWDASKPEGVHRRVLDTTRAERELGFKPSVGLREGLRHTIAWYRRTQKGA